MTGAVVVENLWTNLGNQQIHAGLSFDANEGEVIALLGPSGCGKTTALRILGGLLPDYQGNVSVAGLSPQRAWRQAAFVFQTPRLVPWRTALGNAMLGMELRGGGNRKKTIRADALHYLQALGLEADTDKYPVGLSGGERHRVALARAFALEPNILFMDEPFAGLDLFTRQRLWELTLKLCQPHRRTIVLVTHNLEEALFLADRIFVLSRKPSRVTDVVEMNVPHPRTSHDDPAITRTRQHLLRLLHETEITAEPAIRGTTRNSENIK